MAKKKSGDEGGAPERTITEPDPIPAEGQELELGGAPNADGTQDLDLSGGDAAGAQRRDDDNHAARPSRRDRADRRYDDLVTENASERGRREAAEREAAALRARLDERERGGQAQRQGGAERDELAQINQDLDDELDLVAKSNNQRAMTKYRELEARKYDLLVERALQKRGQQPGGSAGGGVDPAVVARRAALLQEHPWIEEDPNNEAAVASYFNYLVAKGKPAKSLATLREAAAHVAAEMGKGGTPRRTSADDRQRLGNIDSRDGGDRSSGPADPARKRIKLTGEELKWASQAGLSPKELGEEIWNMDPSRRL